MARPSGSRLVGIVTSVFALVTTTGVMQPAQMARAVAAEAPVVVALPTTTATIPATSLPPQASTRPSLSGSGGVNTDSEYLALSDRAQAVRAQVPLEVPTTDVSEPPIESGEPVETVDLAVFALDLGDVSARAIASDEALVMEPVPDDPFECHERAAGMPLQDAEGRWDSNLIAQMTYVVFECVTSVAGFVDRPPTTGGWDPAAVWGMENMAQQVAAESVVVAYCESQAFAGFALAGDNPWGYGGLFQMGAREMRMFGFSGASKFDPVDNAYSAATYYVWMSSRGSRWDGWGPWAVVNTGYNDEVNDRVKVPVLPRFTSTDPDYSGRRGVELPAWAVDPWSNEVPGWGGCPTTGRAWPAATPLER